MPGKIVSVPFLSQIEDIDRCLKDSKCVKTPPVSNFSFSNSSKNMANGGKNNGSGANHGYGNGYNYNNSYNYNKGSNAYYKKSGSNSKGYASNGTNHNGGNYDSYKNYDYMKYNTRKNAGVSNTNYFYNQQQVPSSQYNKNSLYTSQMNTDKVNPSNVIAEQLKQTYPQIYQNTHADVYQAGSGASAQINQMGGQTNYDFSQLSNSLENIQFAPAPSMNSYMGSQRSVATDKFANTPQQPKQQPLGYANAQSLNMLMADTMQPSIATDNITSMNVTSINSYIPSELLDAGNAPYQSVHNPMVSEMSPVPNAFMHQPDPVSAQAPLVVGNQMRPSSAASLPQASIRSPLLQGGNAPFEEKSASMSALGNGDVNTNQKSNMLSMGWGANNMNVQSSLANSSSMNSTATGTNSNSSMFGIWNNDMSVWS